MDAISSAHLPMRLGYLVPEWPGQTHAFFWRELGVFRSRGHAVSCISTRRPDPAACRHDFAAQAANDTCYLHPPQWISALTFLASRPRRLLRALRYVSTLEESTAGEKLRVIAMLPAAGRLAAHARHRGLTHVHGHSCSNTAHILAMGSCLGDFNYSLTLHGDLPVYGKDHRSKMQRAAFVSAVTRPLQAQIRDQVGLDMARIPTIAMGVDVRHFAPPNDRTRGSVGRLHLVTVARLNHTKGHQFALEAVAALRAAGIDVRYSIAGDGPERSAIETRIAELDLGDAVALKGNLGEAGVLDLLHDADAFILSSFGLGEAAPVSVMEAMACGLPVICSRIGGVGDMIAHGISGLLVNQRDVAGLARAIEKLARDLALRKALGESARARAVALFDHEKMADRLIEAIAASHARARGDHPGRIHHPGFATHSAEYPGTWPSD